MHQVTFHKKELWQRASSSLKPHFLELKAALEKGFVNPRGTPVWPDKVNIGPLGPICQSFGRFCFVNFSNRRLINIESPLVWSLFLSMYLLFDQWKFCWLSHFLWFSFSVPSFGESIFLKVAQAGGVNLGSFWFFLYFLSQKQCLRPLGYCAPPQFLRIY